MIVITSRRDGFRRCGVSHPGTSTEYPDDHFTKEQLTVLETEPMLMVRRLGGPQQDFNALTVAELKAVLDKAGQEYPADARKAELAALVEALPENTE